MEVPTPAMTGLGERHQAAMGLRRRNGHLLHGVRIRSNLRVSKARRLQRIGTRKIERGRQSRSRGHARIRERGRVDIHAFLTVIKMQDRSEVVLSLCAQRMSFWRVWSVDGIALANGYSANATQT